MPADSLVAMGTAAGRVGRPRATGESGDARRDFLDAAAELFVERGYTATTTRAIADRAGLRQASLYHYFEGKEDLLAELLAGTVRPSLELATELLSSESSRFARLWALCRADIALLCGGPHNLGALYLLPELSVERFDEFRVERAALKSAYGQLITGDPVVTDLVFGLVEGVILTRREAPIANVGAFAAAGADAAVLIAGCPPDGLPAVRAEAAEILG